MNFFDILKLAAVNLWRRKLRTLLTVLGVIIGTVCIVVLVAMGLGNLEQFNEMIMQNTNLTQIEVYPGGGGGMTMMMGGGMAMSASSGGDAQGKITNETIDKFKKIPGVKSATGFMDIPAFIILEKYESGGNLSAVDPVAMDFKFMDGQVFSNTDNIEIVIGANARSNFYNPRDMSMGYQEPQFDENGNFIVPEGPDVEWVNHPVKYFPSYGNPLNQEDNPDSDMPKPKEYRAIITGVLEKADNQQSYSMFISLDAANKLIRENRKLLEGYGIKEGVYQRAYVNATDADTVEKVLNEIKSMGFQTYSPTEYIKQMQDEQSRQQGQLIAIGLISLIVSAIGIANTMLASILERSREIGVMKVIGLSIPKINFMFLVEAAMIGLIGGLIGIAISYIFAGVVSMGGGEMQLLGMYFQNGVRLVIPFWLSLGAVAIATFVGIVSGIYPAHRATKMSPLEAIRS